MASNNTAELNLANNPKWKEVLSKAYKYGAGLKVGILEGATNQNGNSVAEYAFYNEFGTVHIPARPFMRNTIRDKNSEWADIAISMLKFEFGQADLVAKALKTVGLQAAADIRVTIEANDFIANAPSTQSSKGNHKPILVDTGALRSAIDSEVTKGK